ncbi:alpha/beta fold hydrolase, partial [Thermodesulfobacteriota bacterium]
TLRSYAGSVRSLIERTIPGPFAIVGHSLGGAITLRIALDAPDGLSGIVPVCTAAVHPMAGAIAGWIRADHTEAVQKICRDFLYRRGTRTDLVKLSIADLGRVAEETLLNDMVIASRCDMEAKLSSIETPALVVAGGQDRLCPPEHSLTMAERIPRAKLKIIEDAGHMVMIERPRKLIGALEPFLYETLYP